MVYLVKDNESHLPVSVIDTDDERELAEVTEAAHTLGFYIQRGGGERAYKTDKGWAFVHLDQAEEVQQHGAVLLGIPASLAAIAATTLWVGEDEPLSVVEKELDYWLSRVKAKRVGLSSKSA